jgi:hypothetical protein
MNDGNLQVVHKLLLPDDVAHSNWVRPGLIPPASPHRPSVFYYPLVQCKDVEERILDRMQSHFG